MNLKTVLISYEELLVVFSVRRTLSRTIGRISFESCYQRRQKKLRLYRQTRQKFNVNHK